MSKVNYIEGTTIWSSLQIQVSTKWATRLVILLCMIALFANFLANDRPLYCKADGQTYFPVIDKMLGSTKTPKPGYTWYEISYESALWPPIPFASNTHDLDNKYKPPFSGAKKDDRHRHFLGTGILGKDVAAGLVYGTRLALVIGICSILLAALIGLIIGGIAGYFGDYSKKVSWLSLIGFCIGLIATFYYTKIFFEIFSVEEASIFKSSIIFIGSFTTAFFMGALLFMLLHFVSKKLNLAEQLHLPIDLLLMRLIEIIQSIPALLILLVLAAIFSSRSIWIVIFIIAFVKWTGIAKFVRAELMTIRTLPYIASARASGLSEIQILIRHALPNAMPPIYIAMAFGIASAILLEATISFLGIGIDPELMSWGKMLAQARQKPSAWWLAIFPGLMIFICVVAFNMIGDQLSKLHKG